MNFPEWDELREIDAVLEIDIDIDQRMVSLPYDNQLRYVACASRIYDNYYVEGIY